MQKWEYIYLDGRVEKLQRLVDQMNAAGNEGWELVTMIGIKKGITADMAAAIMKRPQAT